MRQRTKQLPSMEAGSHRPSTLPPGSTNSSTRQRREDTSSCETRLVTREKKEILGDGTDIHRGSSEESNQEL